MNLAIMQPYLFPYIGYFQLINLADKFVIYDDVDWIKNGWINRNRILSNNSWSFFTIPVKKSSISGKINTVEFSDKFQYFKNKALKSIEQSYSKAKYFDETYSLVRECLDEDFLGPSGLASQSILKTCEYLEIDTSVVSSSSLEINSNLKAEQRVIDINRNFGSTAYINPIGGQCLYNHSAFEAANIQLKFIKPGEITYQQFTNKPFIPSLSIIDVMMFNSKETIHDFLQLYILE